MLFTCSVKSTTFFNINIWFANICWDYAFCIAFIIFFRQDIHSSWLYTPPGVFRHDQDTGGIQNQWMQYG